MTRSNWTISELPDLTDTTIIVTGATSGLGEATSRALAGAGARVVMPVRNPAKGHAVAATIEGTTEVHQLDLGSLTSIHAFADTWSDNVDVLVNNAGIMQVPEGRTPDGFELQIGTNHLGHFALTNLLLPHITGRVVTLSSDFYRGGKLDLDDINWERRPYDAAQAYKDSKLANLLFAGELQRRLTALGSTVRSIAAHPGIVRTGLFGHVGGLAGLSYAIGSRIVGQDVVNGALPTLFAATQDLPGGTFVGPNGFRHLRGYPEIVESSKEGRDTDLARRLWEVSEAPTRTELSLTRI